jgi:hypothetical protein
MIRLEAKVEALTVTIAANNIASVERDTRIEQKVDRIDGTVRDNTQKIGVMWTDRDSVARRDEMTAIMWNDRSIWNWVQRGVVLVIPLLLGLFYWLERFA